MMQWLVITGQQRLFPHHTSLGNHRNLEKGHGYTMVKPPSTNMDRSLKTYLLRTDGGSAGLKGHAILSELPPDYHLATDAAPASRGSGPTRGRRRRSASHHLRPSTVCLRSSRRSAHRHRRRAMQSVYIGVFKLCFTLLFKIKKKDFSV